MKKYLLLLLALVLLLAGCSGRPGEKSDGSPAPSNPEQSQASGEEPQAKAPPTGEETPIHDTMSSTANGDVIEISERLFIAQTNDIYFNTEDYLGKTIKYEGLFKSVPRMEGGEAHYFVIRYGPGCCGYDGEAGFEVSWDGEWPEEDDWCEVVGVLEAYDINGWPCLRLALSSLTVLEERGAEFVST